MYNLNSSESFVKPLFSPTHSSCYPFVNEFFCSVGCPIIWPFTLAHNWNLDFIGWPFNKANLCLLLMARIWMAIWYISSGQQIFLLLWCFCIKYDWSTSQITVGYKFFIYIFYHSYFHLCFFAIVPNNMSGL